MKFLVTCLKDDGSRTLASRSKVFASLHEAAIYSDTIASQRVPMVVHVTTDAQHAAEFVFDQLVEKHPHLIDGGDPEEAKAAMHLEIAGDNEIMVVFVGNDVVSAFHKMDILKFSNELERLVLGV